MVRDKLTATNYKSQVDCAREAEGASNTRPRVALRSCSAGDAARNGKEQKATPENVSAELIGPSLRHFNIKTAWSSIEVISIH